MPRDPKPPRGAKDKSGPRRSRSRGGGGPDRRLQRIEELAKEQLAPRFDGKRRKPSLVNKILRATDGRLSKLVKQWMGHGSQKVEVNRLRDAANKAGLSNGDVGRIIGLDSSNVWRHLERCKGSARSFADMKGMLAPRLTDYSSPSPDELLLGGYTDAITHLRREIERLRHPSVSPGKILPLTKEAFLYLWHSMESDLWRTAKRRNDETLLGEAASQIQWCVRNKPPRDPVAAEKTHQQLTALHSEWDFWFLVIVLARPDPYAETVAKDLPSQEDACS